MTKRFLLALYFLFFFAGIFTFTTCSEDEISTVNETLAQVEAEATANTEEEILPEIDANLKFSDITKAFCSATTHTLKVNVTASIPWKVSANTEWVRVTPAFGTTDAVLRIAVAANPSSEVRSATITLRPAEHSGVSAQILLVEQEDNIRYTDEIGMASQ